MDTSITAKWGVFEGNAIFLLRFFFILLTQTVDGVRSRLFSVAAAAEVGFDDAFVLAQGGAVALDHDLAGFQPKPAVEVIIVAMKPLKEKTFTEQAESNGKGVTWLDDCRIPNADETMLTTKDRPCSLAAKNTAPGSKWLRPARKR
jgi:hypothetical protein